MLIRLILISLICLFLSGCLSISSVSKKSGLKLAPKISSGKLPNGLKYYYMQSTKPENRCFIRLHVGVGSFFEKDSELGMAHLLEHMAFGPHTNSYSTHDHAVYKIDLASCKLDDIKDSLIKLRNLVDSLKFSDEEIIRELAIIGNEEIAQSIETSWSEKIINNLYSGTLLAKRPAFGDAQKRGLFTKEMLTKFYHQSFHPKNLSLVLTGDYGDLDPPELISSYFLDLAPKDTQAILPSGGELDYKTPVFLLHEKDPEQEEIVFSIQPKKITKPRFALSLLKSSLAFDLAIAMLKRSFIKEARGNSIEGFMFDDNIYELNLKTNSKKDNLEENFLDAYKIILLASKTGFDSKEFNITKNIYLNYLDQAVVQEATWGSDNWAQLILDHKNNRRFAYGAQDYQKLIQPTLAKITAQDCQQALSKALKSGYKFIFGLGPLHETPENIKKLRELLSKAESQSISENTQNNNINFAYKIPNCQILPIAPRVFLPNINAYRIVSKNLNILIKPTDIKQDEILLAIFTDDGFLTMNAEDLARARLAQEIWASASLAKHSAEDVTHLLKDKIFSQQLAIFPDRTQATISTSNKDFRFALEFLRASFLDPAYAESSLLATKDKLKARYEEQKNNMWTPLEDDFPRELSGQDYRVGHESLQSLLNLSRDDLLSWHKTYLNNQSLNIVIIGDIDVDQALIDLTCVLSPIVEQISNHENKKAVKISFKSGVHREYQVDTKEQASKIVLRYPLMFPANIYFDHRLPLLQNIIQDSLSTKTYSPSALITADTNLLTQNWLDILISAPKGESNKILNHSKKLLENLAKRGINRKQLSLAKENYITQATSKYNQNSYWLLNLSRNFKQAEKIPNFERIISDIKAIKAEAVNQLLRTYIKSSNASSAIVHAN